MFFPTANSIESPSPTADTVADRLTVNFFKFLVFTNLLPSWAALLHVPGIGVNWTGIAWILMLVVSIGVLFLGKCHVTMPYKIWLPWISIVFFSCIFDFSFLGLQATLQYICFPIVGFAASTLNYNNETCRAISRIYIIWSGYVLVGFFLSILVRLPFVILGAPGAMTVAVIGAVGLSVYSMTGQRWGAIQYFIASATVILMMTRMGILVLFAIGVFHAGNAGIRKKIFFFLLAGIVGYGVLHSNAFQEKTFGTYSSDTNTRALEDINTNGRRALWESVFPYIEERPWLGNGCRADYFFLKSNGYLINEFHNDWLAVLFCYGILGVIFLIWAIGFQFLLLKKVKPEERSSPFEKIVYASAITLFWCWVGFTVTDNALKYSIQFANFHWVLIGMYYRLHAQRINSLSHRSKHESGIYKS